MTEKMAGELNSWDVRSELEFWTRGGQFNSGDEVLLRGVITNVLHKKDGKVRIQIEKQDVNGLRFGANLLYPRSKVVNVFN